MQPQALSDGEQNYLIRLLSDQESGHARQWYWLEIAQTLAKPEKTRRAFSIGIAIKTFGIKACSPILIKFNIKGAELYQAYAATQTRFIRKTLTDMLLFTGGLLAIMAGFRLLIASMQFALWCLSLTAIAIFMWQVYRQVQSTPAPISVEESALPSAESSLGLTAILLALGLSPHLSTTLVQGLKQHPADFIAPLLINAPHLAPDTTINTKTKCYIVIGIYSVSAFICSCLIGVLPAYWGLALAGTFLCGGCVYLHHMRRETLIVIATWLTCFALAMLAHYL